jgi:hypothetical protein
VVFFLAGKQANGAGCLVDVDSSGSELAVTLRRENETPREPITAQSVTFYPSKGVPSQFQQVKKIDYPEGIAVMAKAGRSADEVAELQALVRGTSWSAAGIRELAVKEKRPNPDTGKPEDGATACRGIKPVYVISAKTQQEVRKAILFEYCGAAHCSDIEKWQFAGCALVGSRRIDCTLRKSNGTFIDEPLLIAKIQIAPEGGKIQEVLSVEYYDPS